MIVSVMDYVDPPFEVSFVVSDLDLVRTFVVIDESVWPLSSLLAKLMSISSLLPMTRA